MRVAFIRKDADLLQLIDGKALQVHGNVTVSSRGVACEKNSGHQTLVFSHCDPVANHQKSLAYRLGRNCAVSFDLGGEEARGEGVRLVARV